MVTKTLHPGDPLTRSPQAKAAVKAERISLEERNTWSQTPLDFHSISKQFPQAHFAELFSIVGIKNAEDSDLSKHTWKGRIVFGGHRIRNGQGLAVLFNELTSTPSTFQAERCLLAGHALKEGFELLQSDCIRAYVQSDLGGEDTFVFLPQEWWPPEAFNADGTPKFKKTVFRLNKSLYGHPLAGEYWNQKISKALISRGFQTIEGWPSVFHNEKTNVTVVLYVDDLIVLGPIGIASTFLKDLRREIELEDPEPVSKYLGVHHKFSDDKTKQVKEYELSMCDFFRQACEVYTEKTGLTLKPADTPFAPELPKDQTIELMSKPGKYGSESASLLMKPLYGARAVKPDLCVPIQHLASEVSRWSAECDRRLHRLYQYIYKSKDETLKGKLSYAKGTTYHLDLWPDADLAGNPFTAKSSSGGWLELCDSHGNCFPLSWGSKKQDCTANHTAEAETYSLSTWLRGDGIPAQYLMSKILCDKVDLNVHEDNAACIIAVAKGYSPAMRYLPRQTKVSLDFLHDTTTEENNPLGRIKVVKADTKIHKGDFFTKALSPNAFAEGKRRIGLG